MDVQNEMEEQFLELREFLIKDSQDRFKFDRESREYPEGWPDIAPENIVLSKLGLSDQELEELEADLDKSDERIVQHYIENVRPDLVKGGSTPNDALRMDLPIDDPALGTARIARPFNCTIVTDDPDLLNGLDGEVHNPWLDPVSAEYQDMLVAYRGRGGWGCRRRDERSGRFECHWLYRFPTTEPPAQYRFTGGVRFNGFFSCLANDRPGICRSARVLITLMLRVYQSGSVVHSSQVVIRDYRGDRINAVGSMGEIRWITSSNPVFLDPNGTTAVVVTAHIFARARGTGSYAEINFNDGPRNYVRGQDLFYEEVTR